MILNDLLSRQKHDKSNPHEVIFIPFHMQEVLHANYYNIHENEQEKYLVQTRPQTETSSIALPKVNCIDKVWILI